MALMTPEQKRDAFKAINQAESDYYSRLSQQETVAERKNKTEITRLVGEFNEVLRTGNQDDAMRVYTALNALDPDKAKSYYDAFFATGGTDELQTVIDLQLASSQGRLTEDMILDAINGRRLSKTSSGTFFSALQSQNNAEHQDAMRLVRGAFNINDKTLIVSENNRRQVEGLRYVAQFQSELIRAERADPNVDRIALADAFIARGGAEKRLNAEKRDLQSAINGVFRQFLPGINQDDNDAVIAKSLEVSRQTDSHDHQALLEMLRRIKEIDQALEQM